jgi:hypothetical protein
MFCECLLPLVLVIPVHAGASGAARLRLLVVVARTGDFGHAKTPPGEPDGVSACRLDQSAAALLAIDDLRFAAWLA